MACLRGATVKHMEVRKGIGEIEVIKEYCRVSGCVRCSFLLLYIYRCQWANPSQIIWLMVATFLWKFGDVMLKYPDNHIEREPVGKRPKQRMCELNKPKTENRNNKR